MFIIFAFAFICSCLLSGIFRKFALSKQWFDIPNHRSAHENPTPRGGGVAFAASFLLLLPYLIFKGSIHLDLFLALIVPGTLVVVLGIWDDYYTVSAAKRFFFQVLLCSISLLMIARFSQWQLPFPFWLSSVLALVYLVWLANLYNFMDGINGLASIEAITVSLAAASIYWFSNHEQMAVAPLLLAVSVFGFLFWNFPKAFLFMGDSGSVFLGFVLGIFSLQALNLSVDFFVAWLILLAVFITDATVTLIRRALDKQKLTEAHSTHAYQHASRVFKSHGSVSLAVMLINLLYLFPIALALCLGYLNAVFALIVAYLPLLLLVLMFNAGKIVNR